MKHLFYLFFALSAGLWPLTSMKAHGATFIEGQNLMENTSISFTTPGEKPYVVLFLSAKCPCSASHEELLNSLSTLHPEVQFIGVHSNSDETAAEASAHFKAAGLKFPVIQDQKNFYANKWGALKTPHAFLFSAAGDLLYQGGVTDSHVGPSAKKQFLKEILEDLKSQKPLRHKEGKALGCYIKRETT